MVWWRMGDKWTGKAWNRMLRQLENKEKDKLKGRKTGREGKSNRETRKWHEKRKEEWEGRRMRRRNRIEEGNERLRISFDCKEPFCNYLLRHWDSDWSDAKTGTRKSFQWTKWTRCSCSTHPLFPPPHVLSFLILWSLDDRRSERGTGIFEGDLFNTLTDCNPSRLWPVFQFHYSSHPCFVTSHYNISELQFWYRQPRIFSWNSMNEIRYKVARKNVGEKEWMNRWKERTFFLKEETKEGNRIQYNLDPNYYFFLLFHLLAKSNLRFISHLFSSRKVLSFFLR